ncbi:MAG: sulfite exporter TauE/SafE family protein [Armatimonadota bacterium]|nr:sulfite exporter TauE/SafE family protein [Armatimonadota bacterium]
MWSMFLMGLIAGFAATPHCLGMCGGFPLHLAKSSNRGSVILRQILFVIGKTFTYIFLGTLVSALGAILFKNTAFALGAPVLRFAAGFITVIFGLVMLGIRLPSFKPLQGISEAGLIRNILGGLLTEPGPIAAFLLGLGVGFLPCPLPMGMLAISAASHNAPQGMALMAGVGLGTAPGLLALGLFGVGLDRKFAKMGMRAAGIVVVAIGLLTIGRVTGVMLTPHNVNRCVPSCCGEEQR